MKNKNIKKVNIVFESLPQFLGLNENLEEAKKIFSKLGFDENSPEWKEFYDIFSSDIDLMDKFVKWLEDGDEEDLRFIIDTIKRAKEAEVSKTEINKFQSLKQYSRGIEKLISDKEKERIKKEVEEKIKKKEEEFFSKYFSANKKLEKLNKHYKFRDFYKLDDQGKKILTDVNSGEEFPFSRWYNFMGRPSKAEMIKEIKGHISFMDDEIEQYQTGVDRAYKNYKDPEGMLEYFKEKLEIAKYMKDYWEYVLDAAYEFFEDME